MEAKLKAKELVEKFRDDKFTSQITTAGAKQCASICCQEIIKTYFPYQTIKQGGSNSYEYWQNVLTEIQSL